MPQKVPNIQRIINNDILKIVNKFSREGGGGGELLPLSKITHKSIFV